MYTEIYTHNKMCIRDRFYTVRYHIRNSILFATVPYDDQWERRNNILHNRHQTRSVAEIICANYFSLNARNIIYLTQAYQNQGEEYMSIQEKNCISFLIQGFIYILAQAAIGIKYQDDYNFVQTSGDSHCYAALSDVQFPHYTDHMVANTTFTES